MIGSSLRRNKVQARAITNLKTMTNAHVTSCHVDQNTRYKERAEPTELLQNGQEFEL